MEAATEPRNEQKIWAEPVFGWMGRWTGERWGGEEKQLQASGKQDQFVGFEEMGPKKQQQTDPRQ